MRLVREVRREHYAAAGTACFQAYADDGLWVGWVFDDRDWLGDRFDLPRWHAAWREQGDSAARANTFGLPPMRHRAEAVEWLEATVSGAQTNRQ